MEHGSTDPRRSVRRDRLWNLARAATLLWEDENLIPSPEETPRSNRHFARHQGCPYGAGLADRAAA